MQRAKGILFNIRNMTKIQFLKAVYLIGAIIDGLVAVEMSLIVFFDTSDLFVMQLFIDSPEYKYALGYGVALMWGWTFLCLWGYLKPVERNGILLLTAIPVVSGLYVNNIWAVATDAISADEMTLSFLINLCLVLLFLLSYLISRTMQSDY